MKFLVLLTCIVLEAGKISSPAHKASISDSCATVWYHDRHMNYTSYRIQHLHFYNCARSRLPIFPQYCWK